MLSEITPLIITYNEAPNIERALARLDWAKRILVVDSGSTDQTAAILRSYPRVTVVQRAFTDFAGQCNFGLTQIVSPWVLSLDADYQLSDELAQELHGLTPPEGVAGYRARFVYRIHGHPLRGTLYPPRVILYRREHAFYRQEGHGHRVVVDGAILPLRGVVYHDDRKPFARWVSSQRLYASDEAAYLMAHRQAPANWTDRMRLMAWPAPIAVFLYTLFVKRCLLDGWPGWYYALQRLVAEALIALEIADRRMRETAPGDTASPRDEQ